MNNFIACYLSWKKMVSGFWLNFLLDGFGLNYLCCCVCYSHSWQVNVRAVGQNCEMLYFIIELRTTCYCRRAREIKIENTDNFIIQFGIGVNVCVQAVSRNWRISNSVIESLQWLQSSAFNHFLNTCDSLFFFLLEKELFFRLFVFALSIWFDFLHQIQPLVILKLGNTNGEIIWMVLLLTAASAQKLIIN